MQRCMERARRPRLLGRWRRCRGFFSLWAPGMGPGRLRRRFRGPEECYRLFKIDPPALPRLWRSGHGRPFRLRFPSLFGQARPRMNEADGLFDAFRARGAAIAEACTRCGDCFRACPMTEPAGIGDADPGTTAAAIVDLVTGGPGNEEAIRWTEACSGSGYCIPACRHGINPRFMVQLARGFARRRKAGPPLATRWRQPFQTMSRGVRVLSRLQLPPEVLARFAPSRAPRQAPPEVVFYTGCNVLKTPHIALLCLDILDRLGIDYEVMGGVGQCCGVYQYRAGDFATNSKVAYATIDGLASAGSSTVLSWCPSCQISIGEVSLPNYQLEFGAKPFDLNPFLIFLADRAD